MEVTFEMLPGKIILFKKAYWSVTSRESQISESKYVSGITINRNLVHVTAHRNTIFQLMAWPVIREALTLTNSTLTHQYQLCVVQSVIN